MDTGLLLKHGEYSDQCLLKLWKMTRNETCQDATAALGSTKRLNNRSWRLLNKRFILNQDIKGSYLADSSSAVENMILGYDKLKNLARTSVRTVANSSSDSSNNSSIHRSSRRGTIFSRTGTAASLTDLSEDTHIKRHSQNLSDRALFPQNSSFSLVSMKKQSNLEEYEESEKEPEEVKTKRNQIFYIQNSPSSPGGTEEKSIKTGSIRRQESLFSNNQQESPQKMDVGINRNPDYSDESSTDISDDVYSDEEDDHKETAEEIHRYTFPSMSRMREHSITSVASPRAPKTPIAKSSTTAGTNDSEWMSVSSSSEDANERKNSIIEFPKLSLSHSGSRNTSTAQSNENVPCNTHHKRAASKKSLLSGLFKTETTPKAATKPLLKRSSTTGVITLEQVNMGTEPSMQNRPLFSSIKKRSYIMLSKRFSSSMDISGGLTRSKQKEFESTESIKDTAAPTDDTIVSGKQPSVVGLSDFNVIVNNPSVNDGSQNSADSESIKSNAQWETLSTSLTKYSVPASSMSRRSLLSRSSISLSKLYNNSKFMFTKVESPPKACDYPAKNTSVEMKRDTEESDDDRIRPEMIRQDTITPDLSDSLKQSILIDQALGKVAFPKKVISSRKLAEAALREGITIGDFEEDFDDYHSKGW